MTNGVVRTVDLTDEGADGLGQFIGSVFDKEANEQAFMLVETADGSSINKAELVLVGEFYVLRLS